MNISSSAINRIKDSVTTQREALLYQNPDLLFWVYSLISDIDWVIKLKLVEDCLCLYSNQLSHIQGLEDGSNISLLDLNALRTGNIKILKWPERIVANPVLLSGWVIEIYGAHKSNGTRDHILLTLRDGDGADKLQYTSIAGRNTWGNLEEETLREQAEESPFLLLDKQGRYALGIREMAAEFRKNLETSIQWWKEKIEKYAWDISKFEELAQAEKFLQRLFPKVGTLQEMITILDDIVTRWAYIKYSVEDLDAYPGVEWDIKTIQIWEHSWRYYVFQDENNNTIEYRKLERVTQMPTWYRLAGRWTSRLYLESINQRPITRRLSESHPTQESRKVVPTVQAFVSKALTR